MVASELRIGNWVNIGYDCQVIRIDEFGARLNTHLGIKELLYFHEKDIRPIPLTEEIINNCFDNELKLTGSVGINGIELQFKGNCLTNFYINNPMCHQKTNEIEIKYLHTLQNFYFALCGQELNVKL